MTKKDHIKSKDVKKLKKRFAKMEETRKNGLNEISRMIQAKLKEDKVIDEDYIKPKKVPKAMQPPNPKPKHKLCVRGDLKMY